MAVLLQRRTGNLVPAQISTSPSRVHVGATKVANSLELRIFFYALVDFCINCSVPLRVRDKRTRGPRSRDLVAQRVQRAEY